MNEQKLFSRVQVAYSKEKHGVILGPLTKSKIHIPVNPETIELFENDWTIEQDLKTNLFGNSDKKKDPNSAYFKDR